MVMIHTISNYLAKSWCCINCLYAINTDMPPMKDQSFDLLSYLNSYLRCDSPVLDTQKLEALLSILEKEVHSMHDFLDALVNTEVWKAWQIQPNPYQSKILAIGLEIDRIASDRIAPAYHSKKHMMDVCLMLTYILMQEEGAKYGESSKSPWVTSSTEKWQLLLAAAAHDLGHPGLINSTPYEIEQQSLNMLESLLTKDATEPKLKKEILDCIKPWILATDHAQYGALLERLSHSEPKHVDCLAMLLVEADLASSVLPIRGKLLTDRLSDEWARPYPEKSIALRNQVGYLSFLASLQFVSPHSAHAGIATILTNSLTQLRTQLS